MGDLGYHAEAGASSATFLADTTGDGCADIIGFGNDGVWVARAVGRGGFGAPQFVMPHYGYDAGHWVVPDGGPSRTRGSWPT